MVNNEKTSFFRRIVRFLFRQNKYLQHQARVREVYFGLRARFLGLLTAVIVVIISVLTLIMFFNQKKLLEDEKNAKARTLTKILSGTAEFYLDKSVETTQEEISLKYETIKRECTNFKNYNSDIVKIVLASDRGWVRYSTFRWDYKRRYILPYIKEAMKQKEKDLLSYEYTIDKKDPKSGEIRKARRKAITQPVYLEKGNVVKISADFDRFYPEYQKAGKKRRYQIYRYLWRKYRDTLGDDFNPVKYKREKDISKEIQRIYDIDFLFQRLFNEVMVYRKKSVARSEKWLWNERWLYILKKSKSQAYLDDRAEKAKEINDLIAKRIHILAGRVKDLRRLGYLTIVFDVDAVKAATMANIKEVIKVALIMIALCCIAFLVVLNIMVRNIKRLEKWAIEVSDGNFNTKIEIGANDEIGRLGDLSNYMLDELKVKFNLEKFVSKSAKSMLKKSDTDAGVNLGVTGRTNLAFIFSDVRGFTSFSEKNDPETVVSVLNLYLELQSDIIKSNRGDIDDYVGDEIMAHFSGERRADRAIDTALKIMKKIEKTNRERKEKGLPFFEVGIGVHGGDVVVGNIGSSFRMDFACVGDAVNLTSRLCSSARAGEILVSKELYKSVKRNFNTVSSPSIEVKGKEKKIPIVKIKY